MAREADAVIYTRAGLEICVAVDEDVPRPGRRPGAAGPATRRAARHGARGTRSRRLRGARARSRSQVAKVLKGAEGVQDVAEGLHGAHDFFFLGRHVGYPVALEGALKLKELSYLHAEGYPAGELKHGRIALIEPGTVVVAVVTERRAARQDALERGRGQGARRERRRRCTATDDDEAAALGDWSIRVPRRPRSRAPVLVDRAAAAVRVPPGAPARAQRRPPAQPRQDRDGGVSGPPRVGVGIDLVEVARLRASPGAAPVGWPSASSPMPSAPRPTGVRRSQRLAARFAAKEAAMKALGVGLGAFALRDVEVLTAPDGSPSLALRGGARARASAPRGGAVEVSLAHTATLASAVVVASLHPVKPVVTSAEIRVADEAACAPSPTRHSSSARASPWRSARCDCCLGSTECASRSLCGPGSNGATGAWRRGSSRARRRRRGARGGSLPARARGLRPRRRRGLRHRPLQTLGRPGARRAVPVLAVDVPSGVDPDTGVASGGPPPRHADGRDGRVQARPTCWQTAPSSPAPSTSPQSASTSMSPSRGSSRTPTSRSCRPSSARTTSGGDPS